MFCKIIAAFLLSITIVNSQSCGSTDPICSSWIINNNETSLFDSLTSVQDAEIIVIDGKEYMQVSATGIPSYPHTMSSEDIEYLNSRPKASTDFTTGATTASVGDVVMFGEDIGYADGCNGYWPPGPTCPTGGNNVFNIPTTVTESAETCYTGIGTIGYWVNGVSMFNWWDTAVVNDHWHTMAAVAEQYDLDICSGHSANGEYHHHTHPNCLAELLNDDGASKSPIYGYAADGVPVLGPYVSAGVLAESCWFKRDYDDPTSESGCGEAKKRTCLLVNEFDLSEGTIEAETAGPDTDAEITTMSGNILIATSGYFYEDHYYNSSCTDLGDEYLDEHNGRMDPDYGYVYHVTIDLTDEAFHTSTFPHFVGPVFYGTLDENTITQCSTSQFADFGPPVEPETPVASSSPSPSPSASSSPTDVSSTVTPSPSPSTDSSVSASASPSTDVSSTVTPSLSPSTDSSVSASASPSTLPLEDISSNSTVMYSSESDSFSSFSSSVSLYSSSSGVNRNLISIFGIFTIFILL